MTAELLRALVGLLALLGWGLAAGLVEAGR